MRRSTTLHVIPALAVGTALALIPSVTINAVAHRHAMFPGQVHFSGVGLTALAAAFAAIALTIAGARRNDGRAVIVGTGFSVMAALLALHGFATPGFLVGMNGVVGLTGGATLPVGAAVLALSALPALRRTRNVKPLIVLQIVLLTGVLGLGVLGILVPSAVPGVPEPRSPEAFALLAVGLVLFALLTLRAVRTFLLTRRRADLVVAIGIFWLASALPPAMLLTFMELGWWLGHGFELLGMFIVGVPVALDLRRAAQSRPLVGDVTGADLVAAEEAFLGAHVRALTLSLARKDEYTEEHTRRVALRAVQVGEELGLTGSRLRALATAPSSTTSASSRCPIRFSRSPDRLPTRSSTSSRSILSRATGCSSTSGSATKSGTSYATITSDSTAPDTRTVPRALSSPSTRGSWRSATSTTRSSRSASTAKRGHTSERSRCFARRAESLGPEVRRSARARPLERASPSRSRGLTARKYHRCDSTEEATDGTRQLSGTSSPAATRPNASRNSFEMTALSNRHRSRTTRA